jgi:hypothetical protein
MAVIKDLVLRIVIDLFKLPFDGILAEQSKHRSRSDASGQLCAPPKTNAAA